MMMMMEEIFDNGDGDDGDKARSNGCFHRHCRCHCLGDDDYRQEPNRRSTHRIQRKRRGRGRRRQQNIMSTSSIFLVSTVTLFNASSSSILPCHGFDFSPLPSSPLTLRPPSSHIRRIEPTSSSLQIEIQHRSAKSSSTLFVSSSGTPTPPRRLSIAPSTLKAPVMSRNQRQQSQKNTQNTNSNATATSTDNGNMVAGYFVGLGIIFMLGFSSSFEDIPTNVVEASIPTSSTDLLAIALGESIGGVIGAFFSLFVNFILTSTVKGSFVNDVATNTVASLPFLQQKLQERNQQRERDDVKTTVSSAATTTTTTSTTTAPKKATKLFEQALSDSDFFIANGAALSLLELLGVPSSAATLTSVFIAAIPSQLIKVTTQLKEQQRQQEEELFDELLRKEKQQQLRRQNRVSLPWTKWFSNNSNNNSISRTSITSTASAPVIVDLKELKSVTSADVGIVAIGDGIKKSENHDDDILAKIDQVAIFTEIARWLEYDVLITEFADRSALQLSPFASGINGAVLGAIAGVSSQLYADILYGQFGTGPKNKQLEVRTRPISRWLLLYVETAATAASLFGIYELSQKPISRYIQATLAGGVESCVGSNDFEACIETFLLDNAPGPSPEAQLRALVVNLNMVAVRLQDIAADTTYDDVAALVRAWSVSFMSWLNHVLM